MMGFDAVDSGPLRLCAAGGVRRAPGARAQCVRGGGHRLHGVRTGGALAGLMELIPAAKRDFMDRFSQRKAGKGGSTALVPATSAPEPVGMWDGRRSAHAGRRIL